MATYPRCKVAEGQLTAAQVNANTRAGTIIVPAVTGKTITVVDAWFRAIGGNAGGATAVILTDTAASPVTVLSCTVGALTQNTFLRGGATNATFTNAGTALTKSKGLRIGCTVADLTTATHLDYVVLYKVDSD